MELGVNIHIKCRDIKIFIEYRLYFFDNKLWLIKYVMSCEYFKMEIECSIPSIGIGCFVCLPKVARGGIFYVG